MSKTLISREDPEDVLLTELHQLRTHQNERDRQLVMALRKLQQTLALLNGAAFEFHSPILIGDLAYLITYIKTS